MNAAKVTLTATVVAAVFGLALSFGASPATAHCKGKHADTDCDAVAEGRAQTFSVELFDGDLVTELCPGSTKRKKATDAKFPPREDLNCVGLTLTEILDLHLCQINIIRPERPDMALGVFLTTGDGKVGGALCPDADDDDVYQGEFDATFDAGICEGEAAGATCVTVTIPDSDFVLEKTTQPFKGSEVGEGEFSIRTIIWTPCGELNLLC